MARKPNTVHAYAKAYIGQSRYGHVEIRVYDLMPSGRTTLVISCQTGGCSTDKSYGWKYGVEPAYGTVETRALHEAYLLMKRLDKRMLEFYEKDGSAQSFADFALRVLWAAQVPKIHINPTLNQGYRELEDLPTYHPAKRQDDVRLLLNNLESEVLCKTRGMS